MSRPTSSAPSLPLTEALRQSAPLAALLQRVRESEARWAAARAALPAGLAGAVQPGPIDDEQWLLLASSGSVAAKLRQCLPALSATLTEQGWTQLPIRVRVRRHAP
ncbi:MAG: hypothetical protein ABI696_04155 [Rubrivivax sp.]